MLINITSIAIYYKELSFHLPVCFSLAQAHVLLTSDWADYWNQGIYEDVAETFMFLLRIPNNSNACIIRGCPQGPFTTCRSWRIQLSSTHSCRNETVSNNSDSLFNSCMIETNGKNGDNTTWGPQGLLPATIAFSVVAPPPQTYVP